MNRTLVRMMLLIAAALWALCGSALAAPATSMPDARTSGPGGGPIAILFLSMEPQIDEQYAEELAKQGFAFASHRLFEPLTYEFVRKFNVIVIDGVVYAAAEQCWLGQRVFHYRTNMRHVRRC